MTSSMKKVVHYHISRLRDRQREVRLDAIKELQDIADPDALEPLHTVFQTDPDLEVRRAAQAAGRDIFLKSRAQR